MTYVFMAIFGVLILVADQVTKYLTVVNIDPFERISLIPGVLSLTFVKNEGAAFSMLQGQQWLFALIFVAFAGFIIWEFSKKKLPFKPFERWCVVAVFAGGLGNMIDRIRQGFVTDMIEFVPKLPFIGQFPIFNVADCFNTPGLQHSRPPCPSPTPRAYPNSCPLSP